MPSKNMGGKLHMGHSIDHIQIQDQRGLGVNIRQQKTDEVWTETANHVVANVTVQNLVRLLGENAPPRYQQRVQKLPPSSGAFVIYLGVDAAAIPDNCPPHLQFLYDYDGPHWVKITRCLFP